MGASPSEGQSGRGGDGERAVLAFYGAAADVERRREPAIDAERFAAGRRADDIDNGVDGADLVKVNLLDGNGVNGRLGLAQQLKGAAGAGLHRIAQGSGRDDAENGRERAVRGVGVFLLVRMRLGVGVLGVGVRFVRVLMRVFVRVRLVVMRMAMLVFMAVRAL